MSTSTSNTSALRPDLAYVAEWIAPGSTVLDLGCGNGELLAWLQREKGCRCYGIELDDDKVLGCIQNGVNVIQQNLEDGLAMFGDKSFDTVLQLQSLQMIRNTENMLREIGRVGRESIVTFPNFGYWKHRIDILRGHMPVSKSLPYQWYDTVNLRFSTLVDVQALAQKNGFDIIECMALHEDQPVRWLPNLRGTLALFRLRKTLQLAV